MGSLPESPRLPSVPTSRVFRLFQPGAVCRERGLGSSPCVIHGVAENPDPLAFALEPQLLPLRMVGGQHMGLRMRHEAEQEAVRAADAGDMIHRAVWIDGIGRAGQTGYAAVGRAVTQADLAVAFEGSQGGGIARNEFAFAMADGQVDAFDALGPDAFGRGIAAQVAPAIFEAA